MKKLTFNLPDYPFTNEEIDKRVNDIIMEPLSALSENDAMHLIMNCIDLTTLKGTDNLTTIKSLCKKAVTYETAAVCVYPPFVAFAKDALQKSQIKVASVAGGFPAGQTPLFIKMIEVGYAIEEGADEIDMVISRGKFLEGSYAEVFQEIKSIKRLCNDVTLKVILETGEMTEPKQIYQAAYLAMKAGANFIKTSTGKIKTNATYSSFLIMLDAINQYYGETKRAVGIKPAGGISDPDTAINYIKILCKILGTSWLKNERFRIGASRLADAIAKK